MSYGKMVFDFLLPTFQTSCCTHYKSDFLEVDRQIFERTAVPGISYLLHIRPNGTHLFVIGVKNDANLLQTILRDTDPANCEMYHVEVRAQKCVVKEISPQQGIILLGGRPSIETRRAPDPLGRTPTLYSYYKGDQCVGSASIRIAYDRESNRTYAHVAASIPSTSDRATQVLVTELIRESCTKEVQSFFYSTGDYLVNEMPFSEWIGKLTAMPVETDTRRPLSNG